MSHFSQERLQRRVRDLERQVERLEFEALKYRTLFTTFPHGITVSDAHGNILETNDAAERLLGVDKAEHERRSIHGRQWRILRADGSEMPPEERAGVVALEENRLVHDQEMGIVKPGGDIVWLNVTAAPLPTGEHKLVITYSDISEKKEMESALQRNEARFRRFFESAGFYGYIVSPQGTILEANRTALDTLGHRRDELVGRPLSALYAEESVQEAQRRFEEWKKTGRVRNAELAVQTRSGEKLWVLLNAEAVRDESGGIVYSTSIQVDITERKRVEEALKDSEKKFSSVFHHAPLLMSISTVEDGRYVEVNDTFVETTGYAREEAVGATSVQLGFISGKDRERLRRELSAKGRVKDMEFVLRRKDGGTLVCQYSGEIIEIEDKTYLLSIAADITRLKQVEDNLSAALQDADEKHRELSMLLAAARAIPLSESFSASARKIYDICKSEIGATCGYVALLSEDAETNELLFLDDGGLPCTVDPSLPMPVRGLRAVAYQTSRVAVSNDFPNSAHQPFLPEGHLRLENVLFAPLNIGDKTVGVIGLANKAGGFDDRDVRIADSFGDVAALALEHGKAQERIKESEQRHRIVADFTYDWEYWVGADGTPLYVSPSCERITGYTVEEFMRAPDLLYAIVHPDDRSRVEAYHEAEAEAGPERHALDFRIVARSGEVKWISHLCQYVFSADGAYMGRRGSNRDITERKAAEALIRESNLQLEHLSNRLIQTQESERKLIAMELHDQVGQDLLALKLQMRRLINSLEDGSQQKAEAKAIITSLSQTIEDVRNLSRRMSPLTIQDLGFNAAIHSLIADSRLEIEFASFLDLCEETETMDPGVQLNLYRIVQEALTNAIKHSQAKRFSIRTRAADLDLVLEISDDGIGFDETFAGQNIRNHDGLGLWTIRERAMAGGGRAEIAGSPENGTTITVRVPLRNDLPRPADFAQ